jgi:hypothetical protein
VGAKNGAYEQECEREQNGELNRTHKSSSEIKWTWGRELATLENSRVGEGYAESEKGRKERKKWLGFQPK